MDGLHRTPLFSVFTKRVTWLGSDRNIVLNTIFIAAIVLVVLVSKMLVGLALVILVLTVGWLMFLAKVTESDTDTVFVFLRHIKYRKYYLGRSSPHCEN